jgi:hypothetical protein
MFRKLLLWVFVLSTHYGLCQTKNRDFGDWAIAGSAQRLNFTDFQPQQAYGITTEVMLTNIWGIEFSVAGGQDYFETSAGPLLALYFVFETFADDEDDDDDGTITLGIIAAIIASFEHSNFHIPITQNLELIPNFSLLKYRYMYNETNSYKEDDFLSWSVGIKVGILTDRNWYYNAFAERAQLYYSGRPSGWQIGLNVGYTFKNKKEKENQEL